MCNTAAARALADEDLVLLTAVLDRDDISLEVAQEVCLAVLHHPTRNTFEAAAAVEREGLKSSDVAEILVDGGQDPTIASAAPPNPSCLPELVLQYLTEPDPGIRCAVLRAALDREIYVNASKLADAESAPMRPRSLRHEAWSGLMPFDCVAPLVPDSRGLHVTAPVCTAPTQGAGTPVP